MLTLIVIVMTVSGLMMLVSSIGLGADPVKHWQYRLLGAFLMNIFPAMLLFALLYGLTASFLKALKSEITQQLDFRVVSAWMNWILIVSYVAAYAFWSRSIRGKVQRQRAADSQGQIDDVEQSQENEADPPSDTVI